MKITRRQLRKLIKEFKITGQIVTPKIDLPGTSSGDGFPPIDDDGDNEGPGNRCQTFQEIHESISYLYGTLVEFFINKKLTDYEHLDRDWETVT